MTKKVNVTLTDDVFETLETVRGKVPRSTYINNMIYYNFIASDEERELACRAL